ncbi:voltage-gated potassium channel beta-2 subunit [Phellopilus nigrolimitatus]|nr:voltage-gated potassium channel beta-2 subunit [Phellopilus nigrolimitatus]
MPFRRLGPSGLRVPVFSLGGWLTLGRTVKGDPVKDSIRTVFENGINMFDIAEEYASGQSEREMGRVFKELGLRRSEIIVTTKLFWGTGNSPNDGGLSRKHIIEGTQESLDRLRMDYVDVIFAHRPDKTAPIEETVRAFNYVINKGWAFYWATSEWSTWEIEEAHHVADKFGLIAPIAEQCQHNPLYAKYGLGTTVFSPLAGGLLTGKVPPNSRFDAYQDVFKGIIDNFSEEEGRKQFAKVDQLSELAEKELGCKIVHLVLAWAAKQPSTSTVILGASKPEQLLDNLCALAVLPKLTPALMERIDKILGNAPEPENLYGRPPLDATFKTLC